MWFLWLLILTKFGDVWFDLLQLDTEVRYCIKTVFGFLLQCRPKILPRILSYSKGIGVVSLHFDWNLQNCYTSNLTIIQRMESLLRADLNVDLKCCRSNSRVQLKTGLRVLHKLGMNAVPIRGPWTTPLELGRNIAKINLSAIEVLGNLIINDNTGSWEHNLIWFDIVCNI